jgi:cytidyltransferase-like protein
MLVADNSMRIILNGCFDNFHEGHAYILEYALTLARLGAIRVLVNSDESVKSLKGDRRPVCHSTVRIHAISTFIKDWKLKHRLYPQTEIIDFSTEEELKELIDEFEPDAIIKGNDRTDVKEIVGSDSWPVLIVPRIKDSEDNDISTTRQLNG